jgi:hypothetical protein
MKKLLFDHWNRFFSRDSPVSPRSNVLSPVIGGVENWTKDKRLSMISKICCFLSGSVCIS